ncbi:MAG TPA: hypothetical protein VF265_04805 [Nevskiaceae bacterium]
MAAVTRTGFAARLRYACVAVSALVALVLAGCASTPVRSCSDIAGPGWHVLSHPPANADQLLALQGVGAHERTVWLAKGEGQVFACHYETGLIYPGCSGSRGYVFERKAGQWVSDGVVLGTCDMNLNAP